MILSPSILAADFLNLGRDIRCADEAGTPYIHIDVMDGVFVPSISFGIPVLTAVRSITKKILDVHLMIAKPERHIDEFVRCGADMITFHEEACDCTQDTIAAIKKAGIKAGLAISPDTPVSTLLPFLDSLDMVLVMTVYPGRGGQTFIDHCEGKVREVRRLIEESGRNIDIEVDGGINLYNVEMIADAGANVIVAGSAVFEKEHTADNISYFLDKFKQIEQAKKKG